MLRKGEDFSLTCNDVQQHLGTLVFNTSAVAPPEVMHYVVQKLTSVDAVIHTAGTHTRASLARMHYEI